MNEPKTSTERVTEWRAKKRAEGARAISIVLSGKAAAKLDALADAHGSQSAAIEAAILKARLR
jgi:hypothetical protein